MPKNESSFINILLNYKLSIIQETCPIEDDLSTLLKLMINLELFVCDLNKESGVSNLDVELVVRSLRLKAAMY